MKKIFGIKIGGLLHKILILVLMIYVTTVGTVAAVSIYKSKNLTYIISSSGEKQQTAVENISTETLHQVIESAMTTSNSLQAYIADDMFANVQCDVLTLQTLAEGMFAHRDRIEPAQLSPPNPAKEGQFTAQLLCEEGVDYTESEDLGIAAQMADTMIAMCSNSDYMDTCYFGLADGTHLAIDQHPANKYDENGAIIHIPARQRPWYRKAVETGTICFSDVMYYDLYTGKPCVTCSAPVYANGKLIGVIGIDLFLTAMEEYVEESAKSGGFICIINDQGKVIFAPDANPLFTVAFSEDDADLRQSDKTDGHYSDLDSVP